MNKQEFFEAIAKRSGHSNAESSRHLEAMIEADRGGRGEPKEGRGDKGDGLRQVQCARESSQRGTQPPDRRAYEDIGFQDTHFQCWQFPQERHIAKRLAVECTGSFSLRDFDRQYRVSLAAFALRIVEEEGATLDDLTFGEVGKRWIREWCGGDLEVASEASEYVHEGSSVLWFHEGSL